MQIKKKRKELAAEDTQLTARKSKIEKLLISLIPMSLHSASAFSSDNDIPYSETPI